MVDLCHQNPLNCLNSGQCAVNIALNTSYCQCNRCNDGSLCEVDLGKRTRLKTDDIFLIIIIIGLCFAVWNNILSLEVFLGCKRVRRTNCGIYLIVYSIVSVLSSIVLLVYQVLTYYINRLPDDTSLPFAYSCYFGKLGYNMLVYICVWLSSWVALERGLIVCFGSKTNATRWRSFGVLIVFFAITIGCATPIIVYKCDWDHVPHLQAVRYFFVWFYIVTGILIYVLATIMIIISFARRIHRYGTENGSFIKTFLRLLRTHLLIFIPPVAYGVVYIPYTIVVNTWKTKDTYFGCDISTRELIIKVLLVTLQGAPFVITWLLFVYSSKVYMNEYYMNTWSGQRLAKILIFFERNYERDNSPDRTTRNTIDNQNDNIELV